MSTRKNSARRMRGHRPIERGNVLAPAPARLDQVAVAEAPGLQRQHRQKFSLYHVEGNEDAHRAWMAPYADVLRGRQRVLAMLLQARRQR